MKFIYACDIHGDKYKYEELYKELIERKIKYLVLGGDLLPKFCHRDIEQPKFINEYLNKYFSKLQENNIKCICILGNDDLEILDSEFDSLCSKYSNVYNIDNKKVEIEDIEFIGLSQVLDHPFGCKDRVVIENNQQMPNQLSNIIKINRSKEKITVQEWKKYREEKVIHMEELLNKLPKQNENKKTIYAFHNPPYGIGLDVCIDGRQVGSKALMTFLENSNAYMSLHGHIHESPRVSGLWYNKLNNIICIQPGQTEIGNKEIYYVIVDTDKDGYERF